MKKIGQIFTIMTLALTLVSCEGFVESPSEVVSPGEQEQSGVVMNLDLSIVVPTGDGASTRAMGEKVVAKMDYDVESDAVLVFYDADGNELDKNGVVVETGTWKTKAPFSIELTLDQDLATSKVYTTSAKLKGTIPATVKDICIMLNPTAYKYPNVAPATTETAPSGYVEDEHWNNYDLPTPYTPLATDSYIPGKNYLFSVAAAEVDAQKLAASVGIPGTVEPYTITLQAKPLMARMQIINDLQNYSSGDEILGIKPAIDNSGEVYYPTYYSDISIEAILLNNTLHPETFGNYITGEGFGALRNSIINETTYVSPMDAKFLDRTPDNNMYTVYGNDSGNLNVDGTPRATAYKYAMIHRPRRGWNGYQFYALPVGRGGAPVLIDNALNFQNRTYVGGIEGDRFSWGLTGLYSENLLTGNSYGEETDPNTYYTDTWSSTPPAPEQYPITKSTMALNLRDAFFQYNVKDIPTKMMAPDPTEPGALGFNFWVQGEGTVITAATAVDYQPDLVFYLSLGNPADLYPIGHEHEGKMILNPDTGRPCYQMDYATYNADDIGYIPEGKVLGNYIYYENLTAYYQPSSGRVTYTSIRRQEAYSDKRYVKLSYKTFLDAGGAYTSFEGGTVYTIKLSDILRLIYSKDLDKYIEEVTAEEVPWQNMVG